jgi:hypothetical protein
LPLLFFTLFLPIDSHIVRRHSSCRFKGWLSG